MECAQKWLTFMWMLIITICVFIGKGLAIDCYICNSHLHGAECETLPQHRQYLYKQNCDFLVGNKTHTVCRKMVQNLGGHDRIVRQCGVQGDLGCVKRSGTRNVQITYCHCKDDFCNQGTKTAPSLITILTLTTTAAIPHLLSNMPVLL